ncbi:hypothetical protein A4U53_001015 (plasmid) [Rhizobium ruizarguesonis]|uniref:Uncharacterized protein n=1 Tax=Rhizobium ruizarguesonis TaxID=2081791 RepID=A0ACD5EFC2_9HYPH
MSGLLSSVAGPSDTGESKPILGSAVSISGRGLSRPVRPHLYDGGLRASCLLLCRAFTVLAKCYLPTFFDLPDVAFPHRSAANNVRITDCQLMLSSISLAKLRAARMLHSSSKAFVSSDNARRLRPDVDLRNRSETVLFIDPILSNVLKPATELHLRGRTKGTTMQALKPLLNNCAMMSASKALAATSTLAWALMLICISNAAPAFAEENISIYFVGCAAPTGFHGYLARGAEEAGKTLESRSTISIPTS